MNLKKLFYFFFTLLLFNITVLAANFYVDKSANGANTGLTWSDAWTSFADIDWTTMGENDTLFISGGINNTTYTESMSVKSSGTDGKPFVITKGNVYPHNGEVIIKGDGYNGVAITVEDQSWIVITDLTINDWYRAIRMMGTIPDGLHDIVIDNVDGRMAGRFIFAEGYPDKTGSFCRNITVRNSDVTTFDDIDHQTDFVYVQYAANLLIENNSSIISNNSPDEHNDHIQTLWVDGPVIVRNNYFEHSNTKKRNSQGIFFENFGGTFEIYNNIIVMPFQLDGKIYFKRNEENSAHSIINNNTIYALSGDLIYTTDENAVIKNNILYTTGFEDSGTSYIIRFNGVSGNNADIENNLFYDPTNSMQNLESGNCIQCIEDNPQFVDIDNRDFSLLGNSPAIDAGISTEFDFDYLWQSRPVGNGWDIGAFEFDGIVSSVLDETINPDDFNISVYPNPFNAQFTISFSLQQFSPVNITLFNVTGEKVKDIIQQDFTAGGHSIPVNVIELPSGIYFLRMNTNAAMKTAKLVYLK